MITQLLHTFGRVALGGRNDRLETIDLYMLHGKAIHGAESYFLRVRHFHEDTETAMVHFVMINWLRMGFVENE